MALAIDASTPAVASHNNSPGATSVTTAAFTTPANVFLVALAGRDVPTAGADGTGTVSGAGLTWTLAGRKTNSTGATGVVAGGTNQSACADVWVAYSASALTAVTVTDTRTTSNDSQSLQVMVLTGAETTWGGAIAANAAASGAPTVTLPTTRAGSHVIAVSTDWSQTGLGTAGSGVTIVSEVNYTGLITVHNLRTTATVTSSGTATTVNMTAPATQQYNIVAIEVRTPAAAAAPRPVSTFVTRQARNRASNW